MNKAGRFVSNLSGEAKYKSFLPSALPPEIVMDKEMVSLLVDANKQLFSIIRKNRKNEKSFENATL